MAGHSKWHNIRVRKMRQDLVRGRLFAKLTREIQVAARLGGPDPETNPRLRAAIDRAKEHGMPMENIERAIKKGAGELEGEQFEEVIYEGYGPGGVAILVEALTDNRNRTTSELRRIFQKHGGSLGEAGSVAWVFEKKALAVVDANAVDEDTLLACVLDAGAEDVQRKDSTYEILAEPRQLHAIRTALERHGIPYQMATIANIPKTTVPVEGDDARKLLALLRDLEDHDDVQNVSANFDIPDALLEEIGEAA
ncbi:putative transcriptional regulatory protein [bacterium HR17]|uniref:Probable transcriptional regulatory protein HRbin17_01044 n=1 Tax=Candidatus Fervidibacter japonicus TaxID=2035412 RepID=A0A2H5XBG2_9BACT|nr:putative transcriptional regulatory protein [bacterium HR17]